MKDKPFIISFILLFSFYASSQQVFEHISSAQGLSTDKVTDIIQDRDGFYWIATTEGLNRFDGSTFKVYRHDKNDSASLSHNNCTSLLEDDNGDIWISTFQGVNRFIKKQGIFKRFYFHHNDINENLLNCAMDLTKDHKGNIWVSAYGLWKINSKDEAVKVYLFNENDSTTISDASQCLGICFDKKQNGLWIATSKQLNFFNISTEKFYHHDNNPYKWPVFTWANKWPRFTGDKEGNIWLYDSYEKNLHLFEPGSAKYEFVPLAFHHPLARFTNDNNGGLLFSMELQHGIFYNWRTKKLDTLMYSVREPEQATNYKINTYYTDRNRNVWLCTLNGLFVSKGNEKKYQVHSFGNNEFNLPVSINGLVIRNGIGWMGINNILFEYNFKERKLTTVYKYPSYDGFRPLLNDGDSLLWLSTENKVVRLDFKTKKIRSETPLEGSPYFFIKDVNNKFWIGTWNAGFYKLDTHGKILEHYTGEKGLKNLDLVSCFSDGKDCVWVGYNGGAGFSRFDFKTETFESFMINSVQKLSPQINTINAITQDKLNNLWLGTYGGGLYYFDRKKNIFTNYSVQDGLSGDYINTLTFDENENLWISTSVGIDIMNTLTGSIYHINESMKFGANDHIHNIARAGKDSFFYFTTNKILSIQPGLYRETYSTPSILISSFKVLNKEYPDASALNSLTLPYKRNFFTVSFSVLKVSPSIPASYKYKLEGFDNDWIIAGNRGIANYTNVPPGKYKLLLNATDEIGRWKNEPQSILIIITPPFWKTWWFISLLSITILSALYAFYRYRMAQVKKMYSLRSKISQDLHDEVGATLSSIHVYSSVASRVMDDDVVKAQDALKQINVNTRQVMENMNDIVWAMYTGNKGGISFENKLKNYGYELLTPLNIACTYHINKDAEKLLTNIEGRKNILLITKEAINNIAKHSDATEASINLKIAGKDLQLEIIDNGKGLENKKNGNGFQNMKSRTEALGGHFHFFNKTNGGTHIKCIIPITSIRD